jgi:hypothetical protein
MPLGAQMLIKKTASETPELNRAEESRVAPNRVEPNRVETSRVAPNRVVSSRVESSRVESRTTIGCLSCLIQVLHIVPLQFSYKH